MGLGAMIYLCSWFAKGRAIAGISTSQQDPQGLPPVPTAECERSPFLLVVTVTETRWWRAARMQGCEIVCNRGNPMEISGTGVTANFEFERPIKLVVSHLREYFNYKRSIALSKRNIRNVCGTCSSMLCASTLRILSAPRDVRAYIGKFRRQRTGA